MSDNKNTGSNTSYTGYERPSGKPSTDYISHGLKPTAPSIHPSTKPAPQPKKD